MLNKPLNLFQFSTPIQNQQEQYYQVQVQSKAIQAQQQSLYYQVQVQAKAMQHQQQVAYMQMMLNIVPKVTYRFKYFAKIVDWNGVSVKFVYTYGSGIDFETSTKHDKFNCSVKKVEAICELEK